MYRIIKSSTEISDFERRSIIKYTGNHSLINNEQAEAIENVIKNSETLDSSYEYKRGITLTLEKLVDLINRGYYEPKRLTSWTLEEGLAETFALEKDYHDDKIPIVLCYRGSRWLDYGVEVSEWSQHPEEDEFIFSSKIKMSISKNEIDGFDLDDMERLGEIVYINLYD